MKIYHLLLNTNAEIIKGKVFKDSEKKEISKIFLSSSNTNDEISLFREKIASGDPDGGKYISRFFYSAL